MINPTTMPRLVSARRRRALAAIEGVVAINALGGMAYALGGAAAVPTEWLDGTPFDSYLIPGLYLGVVVGGGCLAAAYVSLRRPGRARIAGLASSAVMVSWIVAQIATIGYRSPLQPLTAATGLTVAYLAALP
jgi:hypothetical protein